MRRWLIALAAAVLTSSVGIGINLATDLRSNGWAWAVVGVLTLAIGVIAALTQPATAPEADAHNVINGNVTGAVVQARDIKGRLTLSGDRLDVDPDH